MFALTAVYDIFCVRSVSARAFLSSVFRNFFDQKIGEENEKKTRCVWERDGQTLSKATSYKKVFTPLLVDNRNPSEEV